MVEIDGTYGDCVSERNEISAMLTKLADTFNDDYEARTIVSEYIDIFYNYIRIHTLHNMAPLKFEQHERLAASIKVLLDHGIP